MKRFQIVTEADARVLDYGSIDRPRARRSRDAARGRHAAQRAASRSCANPAATRTRALAPVSPIRTVAIAGDHTSLALKAALVAAPARARHRGARSRDRRAPSRWTIRTRPRRPRVQVARGEADAAIVIDGAGLGSTIAANKVAGARAAMCLNQTLARYAREHNGANVLALGATLVSIDEARADRGYVSRHADARAALHPAAGEDPGPRAAAARADGRPDLQRLDSASSSRNWPRRAQRPPAGRCCGATRCSYDCCPDRVRGVLEAGATRLGLHATGGGAGDVAGADRPHAAQARCVAGRDRGAVPRSGRVSLRQRVREPDVGGHLRQAAARGRRSPSVRWSGFRWAPPRPT